MEEMGGGMALSPHGGGKVAGRWVLVDGERPVLVPPLGSHQPETATKRPMLRWAQGAEAKEITKVDEGPMLIY